MLRRSLAKAIITRPVYRNSTLRFVMAEARAHTPPVTDGNVPPMKKPRLDSELAGPGVTQSNPIDIALESASQITTTTSEVANEPSRSP